MYARGLRPLLFLLPPDAAHALAFAGLAPSNTCRPCARLARALLAPHDPRIAVRAMGLEFPSPLGLAGGFDKNALRPRALAALGFGHLELGTVTALAQAANPRPNMFRLPADRALVNRLGFPNEGAERVARIAARARPRGRPSRSASPSASRARCRSTTSSRHRGLPRGLPLAARRRRSGLRRRQRLVAQHGGPARLQAAPLARGSFGAGEGERRRRARRAGKPVPLLLKIAPDLDDAAIEALLAVVDEVGLAGVVATNTTVARAGLATDAAHRRAHRRGGLSGAPLAGAGARGGEARARAPRAEAVVVGVGGIERAEHAMALVRAGADLVQMYTGFVYEGPRAPSRIARELAAMVTREGAASIAELRG